MKIAVITVTNNDYHTLDQWVDYYNVYKSEICLHIIVDNGSNREYLELLKKRFPDSVFIERTINGGTTAAYNDGIRYALTQSDVDAISLVAQDIKFAKRSISELYKHLYSEKDIGIVGPVLFKADSDIIEAYGTQILENCMIKRLYSGYYVDSTLPESCEVDMVPGGANLAKREIYEKVGYQDESLFMYGDETDYDIRIKRAGYRLVVTSKAHAWHQHINVMTKKYGSNVAFYYNNRNILLLNYKYTSPLMAIKTFIYLFICRGPAYILGFFGEREYKKTLIYYAGLVAGVLKYKKNWVS